MSVSPGMKFYCLFSSFILIFLSLSFNLQLLGKRYSHDHPLMVEYKSTTRLFSEACSSVSGMELDLFPWLRFLPNETFRKLNLARDQIDHFVDTELEYIQVMVIDCLEIIQECLLVIKSSFSDENL